MIEENDKIIVNLETNELTCVELNEPEVYSQRKLQWEAEVANNDGVHPKVGVADTRLLNRMRCSAVPAVFGAGMHPDRQVWVRDPREPVKSDFKPKNKYKNVF